MADTLNILIIDDDQIDRMSVRRMLKSTDLSVETAEAMDGAEGIALLEQRCFHCILMDYQLPKENGVRVLKKMRGAGIKVPVIMLTGHGDEQLVVEIMKAGAVDYLSKDRMTPVSIRSALHYAVRVYKAELQAEQAELALRQSEAYTRAIIENTPDAVISTDKIGTIKSFNPAAEKMFGYSTGDVIGQAIKLLLPESYHKAHDDFFNTKVNNGQSTAATRVREVSGLRKNGKIFPAEISISEMCQGQECGYIVITRDITKRKIAKAGDRLLHNVALQVLQERPLNEILQFICEQLRSLFGIDSSWVGLKEPDGSVGVIAMSGGIDEGLENHEFRWDADPEGQGPSVLVIQSGQSLIIDSEEISPGYWRQWTKVYGINSIAAFPLSNRGQVLGVLTLYSGQPCFFNEFLISQLENFSQQVAIALNAAITRQLLQLQTTVLNAAANAIVITDRDGAIQWLNPSFTQLTGYTVEEVMGRNPRMLKSDQQDAVFYQEMWQCVLSGKVWQGEVINRRKDGSFYTEEMTITPVQDEQGDIVNFIAIKQDITPRKQAEAEMLEARERVERAERLASLGTMAAGIAHEINQPLNSLKVMTDGMLYWYKKGKPPEMNRVMENLHKISAQAGRIDGIIKHMRSFVRSKRVSQLNPCNLKDAVEGALSMLANQLSSHGIQLVKKFQDDLPPVLGQEVRLEEIVINLLVNAMQSLDTVDQPEKKIICAAWVEDKVILEISDNGTGISAENKEKIFEPFFTTKPVGVGMGLGLSIVHSVVTSFNGQIILSNNEKGGATLRLEFPAYQGQGLEG